MCLNINKLQKLVAESKLNKVDLAKACGFTRVTLDNVLQGADVKISTISSLAKVLGVDVAYLFQKGDDLFDNTPTPEVEYYKQEITRLQSLLNTKNKASTKVVVEFDVTPDEFIKMGLKDKIVQVLGKK